VGAKLARPRVPPGFVARPRVLRLFGERTANALTVVSAGPGWGKTLAAAAWAADSSAPVGWVSLDQGDGEPVLFWSYVLAALRETGAVPSDNPLREFIPGPVVDAETTRRIIDGLSRLPAAVVLVLDDVHEVGLSPALDGIDVLLRHPIPQLRLVLLTRSDPTLPLHRLRLNGDLGEIRAADLAFTGDEAAALFAVDGLEVARVPLDRLLDRTEGWAAGLRMAALALRRDMSESALDEFNAGDRAAADYLADEVLAALPPQLRTFLLHTCVTERLNGPLADALTAGSGGQGRLEQLVRANAFVVALGSEGHWYRYHPMLREMLQHQLSMSEPDLVNTLHRRASSWFAVHGSPIEAMRHAAVAGDWALLGRVLVTRAAPSLVSVDREALRRILAQLPDTEGRAGAEVHLCAAARLLAIGQFAAMAPHLALAQEALTQLDAATRPAADVLLQLLEHTVARVHGDADAMIAHSGRALELLRGEAAGVPVADEYTAVALSAHGMALLWSGAFSAAERSLKEGLTAAKISGVELARINMLGNLGFASALTGGLREAHAYAAPAVGLAGIRGWSTVEQVSSSHLTLAYVNFQRNNLQEAERQLQSGFAAQPTGADLLPLTALRIGQIRVQTARGRLARARVEAGELRSDVARWRPPPFLLRWLTIAEAEIDLAEGDPAQAAGRLAVPMSHEPPAAEERIVMARAMLGLGKPDRAEDLVAPLRDRDGGAAVDAWVVTALAADHRREDHKANDALAVALELAEPEHWRRPFAAMDPDRVARMLGRMLRLAPAPPAFARELLTELGYQNFHPDGGLFERLTDRELAVLEHLPSMLSNAEIAAQMYVSINTVKAHLKSLYRKLDVSSRRQAVQRARELNLL
jgi:LuxR family maltose regulon positive regulatory protein